MKARVLEFLVKGYAFPRYGEGEPETAERINSALSFGSTNFHTLSIEFKTCEIVDSDEPAPVPAPKEVN